MPKSRGNKMKSRGRRRRRRRRRKERDKGGGHRGILKRGGDGAEDDDEKEVYGRNSRANQRTSVTDFCMERNDYIPIHKSFD